MEFIQVQLKYLGISKFIKRVFLFGLILLQHSKQHTTVHKAIINILLVSCPLVQHKLMRAGGDY